MDEFKRSISDLYVDRDLYDKTINDRLVSKIDNLLYKGYNITDCVNQLILGINTIYPYEYLKFFVDVFIQNGAFLNFNYLIDNIHNFSLDDPNGHPDGYSLNNSFDNRMEYIFILIYRYSIIGRLIDDVSINHIEKNKLVNIINNILPFGYKSVKNNIIIDYYDMGLDNYDWINIRANNVPLRNNTPNKKILSIKLNVIKYYSKFLRDTYPNEEDDEYTDHIFKDWDCYFDVRLNVIKDVFNLTDGKIYNEYLLYLSYFYSFNNSKGIISDLYLENVLLKQPNFDAQIGYDKYMNHFSKLSFDDINYFLEDSRDVIESDCDIISIIRVFQTQGKTINIDLNLILSLYSLSMNEDYNIVSNKIIKLKEYIDEQVLFDMYIKLILNYNTMDIFNYNYIIDIVSDILEEQELDDINDLDISNLIKTTRIWSDNFITETLKALIGDNTNVDILFNQKIPINSKHKFNLEISDYKIRGFLIDIISDINSKILEKSYDKIYKNYVESIEPFKSYILKRLRELKLNSKYLKTIMTISSFFY